MAVVCENLHYCRSYWASTGAYDAVTSYIQMNYKGLKDDIIKMLAGGRCNADPTGFQNDMSIIRSKDDVFTVLINLGYLAFDWDSSECYVPNREVEGELVNAIKDTSWQQIIASITVRTTYPNHNRFSQRKGICHRDFVSELLAEGDVHEGEEENLRVEPPGRVLQVEQQQSGDAEAISPLADNNARKDEHSSRKKDVFRCECHKL